MIPLVIILVNKLLKNGKQLNIFHNILSFIFSNFTTPQIQAIYLPQQPKLLLTYPKLKLSTTLWMLRPLPQKNTKPRTSLESSLSLKPQKVPSTRALLLRDTSPDRPLMPSFLDQTISKMLKLINGLILLNNHFSPVSCPSTYILLVMLRLMLIFTTPLLKT